MQPEELSLPSDGSCLWAGMGDYVLISPDANHRASLFYAGEPPHGDSYHRLTVDGKMFPGYAWGCLFAYSKDSRYLALSWMEKLVERKMVVIDLEALKYFVLPGTFTALTYAGLFCIPPQKRQITRSMEMRLGWRIKS